MKGMFRRGGSWCVRIYQGGREVWRSLGPGRLMPRIQERPPDRLQDADVERLVAIPDPHGFVVRLALGTGARWGELVRMQSTDVQSGVVVIHQTKSGKLRRVPLSVEM